MTSTPIYHAAFQNWLLQPRPRIGVATEFGNAASFWVEYPSGLVDLTRTTHIPEAAKAHTQPKAEQGAVHEDAVPEPPLASESQWELHVDGDRTLRLNKATTAIVIVDMQKYAIATSICHKRPDPRNISYFLHPDLREHPTGLDCVIPLMNAVPALRALGAKVLWVYVFRGYVVSGVHAC